MMIKVKHVEKIKKLEPKKKLFYWDLIRTILFFLIISTLGWKWKMVQKVIYSEETLRAFQQIGVPLVGSPATMADWSFYWFYLGVGNFMANDGHIWGDMVYVLSGQTIDPRMLIWIFSIPAIVFLDYLWAFRSSKIAMKLRVANWTIDLFLLFVWTVFLPLLPNYDYRVWLLTIVYWNYAWWVILLSIFILSLMWLGPILITGFLIFKELLSSKSKFASWMPALLSLGIPGAGQIAKGRYKRGLLFLLPVIPIWLVGLFTFYIPTLIWWLFAAYDVKRNT